MEKLIKSTIEEMGVIRKDKLNIYHTIISEVPHYISHLYRQRLKKEERVFTEYLERLNKKLLGN